MADGIVYSMNIVNRNGKPPPVDEHNDTNALVSDDHARKGVVSNEYTERNSSVATTPNPNFDTSGLFKIDPSKFTELSFVDNIAVGNALELAKIQVLDEIRKSLNSVGSSMLAMANAALNPAPPTPQPQNKDNKGSQGTIHSGGSGTDLSGVVGSLNSINENLSKNLEFQQKRTENSTADIELKTRRLEIETDRHNFEIEVKPIRDLDGERVITMSPRELEVSKNASQAKMATDTNNFELSATDLDDLFGDLPDISEILNFKLPGAVARDFIKK